MEEDSKEFITKYLTVLETLVSDESKLKDAKFCAQLRLAERTFNFFLDQFPANKVSEEFTIEGWTEIKKRRDVVADKISKIIEDDSEKTKRYQLFCEQLKQLRTLGSML